MFDGGLAVPDQFEPASKCLQPAVCFDDHVDQFAYAGSLTNRLCGFGVHTFGHTDDVRPHAKELFQLLSVGRGGGIAQRVVLLGDAGQLTGDLLFQRMNAVDVGIVISQQRVKGTGQAAGLGTGKDVHASSAVPQPVPHLRLIGRQPQFAERHDLVLGGLLNADLFSRRGARGPDLPLDRLLSLPRLKKAFLWLPAFLFVEASDLFEEAYKVLHLLLGLIRLRNGRAVYLIGGLEGLGPRDKCDAFRPLLQRLHEDVIGCPVAEEVGRPGLGSGNFVLVGGNEGEILLSLVLLGVLGHERLDVLHRQHLVKVQNASVAVFHVSQTCTQHANEIEHQADRVDRD